MKHLFFFCLLFSLTAMATDVKISALPSLGHAAFDPTDLFVIVDTPNITTKATTLADIQAVFFTKGTDVLGTASGGTGASGSHPFGVVGQIPFSNGSGNLTSSGTSTTVGICFNSNESTGALVINPSNMTLCSQSSGTPPFYLVLDGSTAGMTEDGTSATGYSNILEDSGTAELSFGITGAASDSFPRQSVADAAYFRTFAGQFIIYGSGENYLMVSGAAGSPVTTFAGHLASVVSDSTSTTPSASPTSSAGVGSTCAVSGTDAKGVVTLTTTAVTPGTGDVCDVSFAFSYDSAPVCVLFPGGTAAQGAITAPLMNSSKVSVVGATSKFEIAFGATDASGHVYVLNYICIQ